MAVKPDDLLPLVRVLTSMSNACSVAEHLAQTVEQVERLYPESEGPYDPYDFYVPTSSVDGLALNNPNWRDRAPPHTHAARRLAIDLTLKLRATTDVGCSAVSAAAALMDSPAESADRRWSTRATSLLRKLRAAPRSGDCGDIAPSALPMIHAGVPKALRDAYFLIGECIEAVKSVMMVRQDSQSIPPADQKEQRATPPSASDGDIGRFRDARWISKATGGGLTGDALSKMRRRNTLHNVRRQGRRPLYDVYEVAEARTQYACVLMDALSENADFRTPRRAERKDRTKPDKAGQRPT